MIRGGNFFGAPHNKDYGVSGYGFVASPRACWDPSSNTFYLTPGP